MAHLKPIAGRDEKKALASRMAALKVQIKELEDEYDSMKPELMDLMLADESTMVTTDLGVFLIREKSATYKLNGKGEEIKKDVTAALDACLQFLEGESTITIEVANNEVLPLIRHITEPMGDYKEGTKYLVFEKGKEQGKAAKPSPFKKAR